MKPTIPSLAKEALRSFTTSERSGEEIYLLKPDRPAWVRDLVFHAHGDLAPDDIRYRFVHDALECLSEYEGLHPEEAADNWEPDLYTKDLIAWLSSNIYRMDYCDQAQEEGLVREESDLSERLQAGQDFEFRECFDLVLAALRERQEEADLEEDTEEDNNG